MSSRFPAGAPAHPAGARCRLAQAPFRRQRCYNNVITTSPRTGTCWRRGPPTPFPHETGVRPDTLSHEPPRARRACYNNVITAAPRSRASLRQRLGRPRCGGPRGCGQQVARPARRGRHFPSPSRITCYNNVITASTGGGAIMGRSSRCRRRRNRRGLTAVEIDGDWGLLKNAASPGVCCSPPSCGAPVRRCRPTRGPDYTSSTHALSRIKCASISTASRPRRRRLRSGRSPSAPTSRRGPEGSRGTSSRRHSCAPTARTCRGVSGGRP